MNNIFDAIPENLKTEVFERLVKTDNVKIERIVSKGHKSPKPGWYDQDKNEWVLVLKGEAVLLFADESSVNLKAGDFIDIPAHKKHRVEWTAADVETIWLAVHY
ncbi:MAG: cupin domain-containing protein [Gammaproteobacteria bacterium]|nr:cupin domain-containing protein [Gammaproteobacteria bacterium]